MSKDNMTWFASARPEHTMTDKLDEAGLVGKLSSNAIGDLRVEDVNHPIYLPVSKQNGHLPPVQNTSQTETAYDGLESSDDVEDYDALELDTAVLSEDTHGGDLELCVSNHKLDRIAQSRRIQRKSIPVRLEETNEKGRFMLTGNDTDIREILRRGLERQKAEFLPPTKRVAIKDLVFTRRFTTFDRQNPSSSESPFHGFFTLFWMGMALMLLKVAADNWRIHGSVFGPSEVVKMMFGRDVIILALTDGLMCGATIFGLVLQCLILEGYLDWNRSGWIIQNLWQTFFLGGIIGWTFFREWPWTHTVFMILHTIVFLMKQHSYAFYNGYLSLVYKRKGMLQRKLQQLNAMSPVPSPATSPVLLARRRFAKSDENLDISRDRRGRPTPRTKSLINLAHNSSKISSIASAIESRQPLDAEKLKAFEKVITGELNALDLELQGKCSATFNYYPKNLNLYNFIEWTFFPTLVYELEYPRQDHINWWYVAEKSAATFGVIGVMMVISQAFIYPAVAEAVRMKEQGMSLQERWDKVPWIVSDMLFPLLLEQLLTWYVIWECVLNVLAEVTRFADRGFYGDWWNSVSWDQWARDWNRPVHHFLLRHVYHSSISAFNLSRSSATFVTFVLSALVHELLMACLFKKVRGYLFTMQLLQLPLVALSRTKLLKGRSVLGNIVFWLGLFVGPSFLTSLYLVI